jgi:hypothetical protein
MNEMGHPLNSSVKKTSWIALDLHYTRPCKGAVDKHAAVSLILFIIFEVHFFCLYNYLIETSV